MLVARTNRTLVTFLCVTVAALALFVIVGCATNQKTAAKPAGPPVHLQTATRDDLIAQYNRQAHDVTSLNASVNMTLKAGSAYSGVIKQYHQINGFIVAREPASIRVIGQAPVVGTNIFDMESDGQTFNIFIPSQNKFLTGPANLERPSAKPIENLRPQHLSSAIFWTEIQNNAPVLLEEVTKAPASYYVLTVVRVSGDSQVGSEAPTRPNWDLTRKIWFDRADLSITRMQTYDPGGKIGSDIEYAAWDIFGEVKYPRQITLNRPGNDYALQIGVTKAAFNEPLPDERFVLRKPAGAELVNVGEESQGTNDPGGAPGGKKP